MGGLVFSDSDFFGPRLRRLRSHLFAPDSAEVKVKGVSLALRLPSEFLLAVVPKESKRTFARDRARRWRVPCVSRIDREVSQLPALRSGQTHETFFSGRSCDTRRLSRAANLSRAIASLGLCRSARRGRRSIIQVPPDGRFLPMTVERSYAHLKTNLLEESDCHDRRPRRADLQMPNRAVLVFSGFRALDGRRVSQGRADFRERVSER